MIKGVLVTKEVKRRLLFGDVLQTFLKEVKSRLRKKKLGDTGSDVVSGKLIRKYRMLGRFKEVATYREYKQTISSSGAYERMTRADCINVQTKLSVNRLFHEDINSRMCPGKKDSKSLKKLTKQKRILLDSI